MAKKIIVIAVVWSFILCFVWIFKDFDESIRINDYETRPEIPCLLQGVDETVIENTILIIKAWGILKYYNSDINSAVDWDTSLIKGLQKVFDGISADSIVSDMITGLKTKEDNDSTIAKTVFTNVDLCWVENSSLNFKIKSDLIKMVYSSHELSRSPFYKYNVFLKKYDFEKDSSHYSVLNTDKWIRLLSVARYWNIINYFYPYKSRIVNWDHSLHTAVIAVINSKTEWQYQKVMLELIKDINDSHAVSFSPEIGKNRGGRISNYIVSVVDSQFVVIGYRDNALESKLKIGEVLMEIKGRPVWELYSEIAKITSSSNRSVLNRDVCLLMQFSSQQDGIVKVITAAGDTVEKVINFYDKTAYKNQVKQDVAKPYRILTDRSIYVNCMNLTEENKDQILELASTYKNIVFDLRGYYPFINEAVAKYFVVQNTVFWWKLSPDNRIIGGLKWYKDKGQDLGELIKPFSGNLILLVDENTQSSAEFCAMALQSSGKAYTIGSQTAGTDGNISDVLLPGGLVTSHSGIGVYYPTGECTQGKGIKIDKEIKVTINAIRENRDDAMAFALSYLNNLKESEYVNQ